MSHRIYTTLTLIGIALVIVGCSSSDRNRSARHERPVRDRPIVVRPPAHNDGGQLNNMFTDGQVYVAGRTTHDQLRALKRRGVTFVLDLRLDNQRDGDFRRMARSMNIGYAHVPMNSDRADRGVLRRVSRVLKTRHDERILLMCKSGNRAGAAYGLFLHQRGTGPRRAVQRAKESGMRHPGLERDLSDYLRGDR